MTDSEVATNSNPQKKSCSKQCPSMSSDHVLGHRVELAFSDFVKNTGIATSVGAAFSLATKRKLWPITFGLGIGLGLSFANLKYLACCPLNCEKIKSCKMLNFLNKKRADKTSSDDK